jgi:hypothetical protein
MDDEPNDEIELDEDERADKKLLRPDIEGMSDKTYATSGGTALHAFESAALNS